MVMDKAYEELKGKYEKSCIENDAIKREREQLLREREKLLRERQQLKGKGQKLKQRLHALAPAAAPALIAAAALPSATLTTAIANGRAKRVVSGAQGCVFSCVMHVLCRDASFTLPVCFILL
jgi:hypothetical protein